MVAVRQPPHTNDTTPPPRLQVKDLYDLLHRHFDPLQWIIDELLPEGLCLFFTRPKVGKSMVSKYVSFQTIMGLSGRVKGDVLYLALDDPNESRIQRRARDLLQGREFEKGHFWYETTSQTLDTGLITQLQWHLDEHPLTRVIVIDIYAQVKPKRGMDVYKSDYDALIPLQRFATAHHLAIILVHHTRKGKGGKPEHWIDEVNGSTGLTGAVDTLWHAERDGNSNLITLNVQGRDILHEMTVRINLDDLDAQWQILNEGDPVERSATEKKILEVLQHFDGAMTPKEISQHTNLHPTTTRSSCRRLLQKNRIGQTTFGSYIRVATSPTPPRHLTLVHRPQDTPPPGTNDDTTQELQELQLSPLQLLGTGKENEAHPDITVNEITQELQSCTESDDSCNFATLVYSDPLSFPPPPDFDTENTRVAARVANSDVATLVCEGDPTDVPPPTNSIPILPPLEQERGVACPQCKREVRHFSTVELNHVWHFQCPHCGDRFLRL